MLAALKAFLSSTWLDLQVEREAVRGVVTGMEGIMVVGMEDFGSRDETPREVSLLEVGKCDIYIGIIAHRYGSGTTHKEYKYARSRGMYCLIYFKHDDAPVPPSFIDTNPVRARKLYAFKEDLKSNHVISTFSTPEKLTASLQTDLHNLMTRQVSKDNDSANKIATEVLHVRSVRQSSQEIAATLMDEQWLGLRVISQLRSESGLTVLDLANRLQVDVGIVAAMLARLARSGVVDVSQSQFICTEKGAEIVSSIERTLAIDDCKRGQLI